MNKDIWSGKWKQLRGLIQEKWGRLTNDDLDRIDGKRERLLGLLQERYGWARERAEDEVRDYLEAEEEIAERKPGSKSGWAMALLLGLALGVSCAATDSGLTVKVKSKLAADSSVSANEIDVTTENKVVTLAGTVDSEAERERAVELARETEGVIDVRNQLLVRNDDGTGDAPSADRTLGEAIDDAGITAAVKTKLLDDPAVAGLEIDVDTREGVVYLEATC
jgi:osmotically-inducible protein OsmY